MKTTLRSPFALVAICLALGLSACAKNSSLTDQIAEDTEKGGACGAQYAEKIRSTLASALLENQELPTAGEIETALQKKLFAAAEPTDSDQQFLKDVLEVYQTLTTETRMQLKTTSPAELLEALVALEIGDRTSPERSALVNKLNAGFQKSQKSAQAAGRACDLPTEDKTPSPETVAASSDALLRGALKAMTVAYQGCQALEKPAMTSSTPNAQGITVTGTHSSGRGKKRLVTDVAALDRTHYYIKDGIENESSCFNVPKNPLIYDFGGKPYATTDTEAPINFFQNAGSGTSVLGIDCSGYVFSAMAAAGLRLAPGKKLKASQVYGVSAKMYMNPAANGMSCLATYQPQKSDVLRSGDILASSGHVVVIDVTGSDPYGLSRAQSASDCTASKLSHKGFDFDVLQSSPSKNGMGLNRFRARDYLDESSDMRAGLVAYAVSACKVKFGRSPDSIPSSARLVRHKQTAECRDRAVSLTRESCVRSCGQTSGLW